MDIQCSRTAIGLGSNIGESQTILEGAITMFARTSGITIESVSSWYTTAPVGGPPQPDYLNGVVIMRVQMSPQQLLQKLLEIEETFGRERRERWGPRTLDLDILLFDDIIIKTPYLQIPHPRLTQRAFVLIPLKEIAPDWMEPVTGETISQLVSKTDCSGICLSIVTNNTFSDTLL